MKPDLFRTPEATLIENLVYEETSEQVQVTHMTWWPNHQAHADYLHKGVETGFIVEDVVSSGLMAQAVANEIVRRMRGKR